MGYDTIQLCSQLIPRLSGKENFEIVDRDIS